MQEYLKKTIANQRTGANIVGISLDNLDLINFSDDFKTTFEVVQGFAKKVDDLNLKNEQEMFRVNLRKRQLEFEQKYAGQDVYNNDDTYKQFMEDYKQLKIQSEEEIQQFKFLTPQEKQIFLKDYQNDYQTDYVKFLDKRNQAEIKKGVNKSIMLIDGIKENLKLEDLSDRTALRKGIDKISSCYDDMIKVGYMDTYTKTIKLADDISETETAMLERQVNEEVIYGTKYTTVEEKKQALKNIQAHLTNPTRINDTVDTIIKTYKLEDTEEIRNYVSGKLKGSYKDMEIKLDKQLYNLEKDKKNTLEDNARKIQEAYYKRDTSKYIEYKFGMKNVSTSQLLDDPDTLKLVTDIPAEDFTKRGLAFPFITEGINTALNGQIADRKKNPNYSLNEIYQPIYDFATEISGTGAGFTEKRKNILIDYALKNGIEPNVLLKGESNSDYFKVSNIMSIGSQENKDNLNIRKLLGKKTEKFDELSQAFSPIKAVGDLMATNYVLGKAKARGQEDMLMQFPELGFQRLMINIPTEEYTREIKMAKEITLNRTPYRYVNYNEQIEEKKELPKPKNTKQSDMFGG